MNVKEKGNYLLYPFFDTFGADDSRAFGFGDMLRSGKETYKHE